MQYKVPQNIDQEDKIFGPLTFIQFIYVLIGGAIALLCFAVFDFSLAIVTALPIIIVTFFFTMVKVQDQPFSRFFWSFIVYLMQPKRRIWHDMATEIPAAPPVAEETQPAKASANTKTAAKSIDTMSAPAQPLQMAELAEPRPTPTPRKIPVTAVKGGGQ